MKKRYFTNERLVKFIVLSNLFFWVLLVVLSYFLMQKNIVNTIILSLFWLLLLFISDFLPQKNAFVRFEIGDFGISSKHFSLSWNEISSYSLVEVYTYYGLIVNPRYKIVFPSVICFGNVDTTKSFMKQKSKECVYIALTSDNLNLLEKYGANKSSIVDDILKNYRHIVQD